MGMMGGQGGGAGCGPNFWIFGGLLGVSGPGDPGIDPGRYGGRDPASSQLHSCPGDPFRAHFSIFIHAGIHPVSAYFDQFQPVRVLYYAVGGGTDRKFAC